jgi:hypothetical protein
MGSFIFNCIEAKYIAFLAKQNMTLELYRILD